jgi:hypothetical protein
MYFSGHCWRDSVYRIVDIASTVLYYSGNFSQNSVVEWILLAEFCTIVDIAGRILYYSGSCWQESAL